MGSLGGLDGVVRPRTVAAYGSQPPAKQCQVPDPCVYHSWETVRRGQCSEAGLRRSEQEGALEAS